MKKEKDERDCYADGGSIHSKHAGHVMKGLHKHHFAKGGMPEGDEHSVTKQNEYDAQGSPEMAEAKEKKKGGRVKKARGGLAIGGGAPKMNLGRPGRKMGGRTGSDKSPLTSAHATSDPMGHKTDD